MWVLLSIFLCFSAQIPNQSEDIILEIPLISTPVPPPQETPPEVPVNELPELDEYGITVRVIIEGQSIILTTNGEKTETIWWARQLSDIKRDFKNAEEIYKPIKIKLIIREIVFKQYCPDYLMHMLETNMHPGTLTVFYMLPKQFPFDGLSSGPWESFNRGILIDYRGDEWTLAHELGHFFGLLHPFDEDYVADTPPETAANTSKYCVGPPNSTPNCKNVMSYCSHLPKHITPGQLDRFRRFFRAKRQSFLERPTTDLLLRHADHPTFQKFQPFPSE